MNAAGGDVHESDPKRPPYPVGLLLDGRAVVVVGGGRVAARRIGALLAGGALVTVVAPRLDPLIRGLADEGRVQVHERTYALGDLAWAWYAMAVTDDADVNAAVVAEAEDTRVFCVRADDALRGTAWTPASGRVGDLTVAVLANRAPRRAAAVRDELLDVLRRAAETGPSADG
ncbi:MAG: precorrin-2 dehydrogenase/sirohydrochlorin ferrochelatase family protein [Nocardioidaceae bacterium]